MVEKIIKDFYKSIVLLLKIFLNIINRNDKFKLKKHEEAIKNYTKAIKLNPNDFNVYYARGMAKASLYGSNNLKSAIEDFDKAIRLNTNYFAIYISRGTSKIGLGGEENLKSAIEDFDKAIKLNPDHYFSYSLKQIAINELNNKI